MPPWCAVVPLSWPWQSICLQPKPISNQCGGTKHGQSLLIGVQFVQEGSYPSGTHAIGIVRCMKRSAERIQTHQTEHGISLIIKGSTLIELRWHQTKYLICMVVAEIHVLCKMPSLAIATLCILRCHLLFHYRSKYELDACYMPTLHWPFGACLTS